MLLVSAVATAQQLNMGTFWVANVPYKLIFTSSAHSSTTWTCLSHTVQIQDRVNRPVVVSADYSVSLSGSGDTYFYSDSSCRTQISEAVVTTGNHSATFWVHFGNPGSRSINLTSGSLLAATQSSSLSIDPFTWMGGGANANWNNSANWHGGVVPTTSARAIFDGNCVTNCSPTINVSIDVLAINLMPPYSGTVTQATGVSIQTRTTTGGIYSFLVAGGTFAGSNTDIVVLGEFTARTGGTFNSTSTTLHVAQDFLVSGTPTFGPNSGTVRIGRDSVGTSPTFTPGGWEFNNLHLRNWVTDGSITTVGTATVNGKLTMNSANRERYNGGTILAKGDVDVGGSNGGTTIVRIVGSSNQTITGLAAGADGLGGFPNLEIASTGGTVSFVGTVGIVSNFTYTSGTVSAGTSTIQFGFSGTGANLVAAGATIAPGSIAFNNVSLRGANGSNTVRNLSGTMTVNGNLDVGFRERIFLNGGTIEVSGGLVSSGSGGGGSTLVRLVGASSRTWTAGGVGTSDGLGGVPNLEVAMTGGTLTIAGTVGVVNSFTFTSGTVDAGTSTVQFGAGALFVNMMSGGATVSPGSIAFNNVSLRAGSGANLAKNFAGTMTVNGTLDVGLQERWFLNGGTIEVAGNLVSSGSGGGGTTLVKLVGSSNRTWSAGGMGQADQLGGIPNLEIATTGGTLTISGTVGVVNNFTHTSGTVDAGTSTVQFGSGAIFVTMMATGTTVAPGSIAFNNVSLRAGSASLTKNFSGTMTVNGTLDVGLQERWFLNGGTIEVAGNLVSSGSGGGGTTLVKLVGSSNRTWSAGGVGQADQLGGIPNLEIAMTGGTLTISGTVAVVSNFTHTSGAVDAGTSTVQFGAAAVHVGLITNGATVAPGTISFHNVFLRGANGSGITRNFSGTLTVNGTLNIGVPERHFFNGGTIAVSGSLLSAGSGGGGTTLVRLVGSNSRTWSAAAFGGNDGLGGVPNLEIAMTGGVLTISGTVAVVSNFTHTSGTIDATTSTVQFGSSATFVCMESLTPSLAFNSTALTNVRFAASNCWDGARALSGTLSVSGTLTINPHLRTTLNGGTIESYGDVVLAGSASGNALVRMIGTANRNITVGSAGADGLGGFPSLEIATTGGTITASGTISIGRNFTYTSGTVSLGTSTFRFGINSSNCTGAQSGTISATGFTFPNVIFNKRCATTQTFATNVNVSGTSSIAIGTVSMAGFSFATTGNLSLASGTVLNRGGGTLTHGSLSNSGTINP